jgi:N utilization substance protein A
MKGSRVQAIIRELRGEKIDIIEWSDEPSVFAANALSPAKVNQVRITDIENRQMEVIVNEDQLSLAIGKRGQNVRLATKLVGWNIDIRSEEELKREIAEQMGLMIASGEPVPLSAIEGVTAPQADVLAEHGINDIDALAATSVDDLVEFLDLSLDQAQVMIDAAQQVLAVRDQSLQAPEEGSDEGLEAESAEAETAPETETAGSDESTAEGYDEAVKQGTPFGAEPDVLAQYSADPVALTEAEPTSADEVLLQEPGRDLRPDTLTPAPDVTSRGAAYIEAAGRVGEGDPPVEEEGGFSPRADFASEASSPEVETETSSTPAPPDNEEAAADGSVDNEKPDAS